MPQTKTQKSPGGLYQFRQLLYDLRGKKSVTEFADQLGLSRTTVDSLLKGQAEPNLKTLSQISQMSPYSVKDLICIIYEMRDFHESPKTSSDAFRFVNLLDDLEMEKLLELIFESRSSKFAKIILPVLVGRSPEQKIQIVTHVFKGLPEPMQKEFLITWISMFLTF